MGTLVSVLNNARKVDAVGVQQVSPELHGATLNHVSSVATLTTARASYCACSHGNVSSVHKETISNLNITVSTM